MPDLNIIPQPLSGDTPIRIGVDLFGLQVRACAERGSGRYIRSLVNAIALASPDLELIYYVLAGRSLWGLPRATGPRAQLVALQAEPGGTITDPLDERLADNPDNLDVFLSPNPLLSIAYADDVPRRVAVWYDVIPELDQDFHLRDATARANYFRAVGVIAGYDAVLTLSDHARADLIRLHQFDPARITTIGAGVEPVFRPTRSHADVREDNETLERLGIKAHWRYVLNVGGTDPRKGATRLIEAFALLPETIRDGLKLVFAYEADPIYRRDLALHARKHGVEPSILTTGWVPDEVLATLYLRAAVMAFPSLYEGFGLPILEAMSCGTPVLCGENSSQIEVGGDAAVFVDAASPEAIAKGLIEVLSDRIFATCLRIAGANQAEGYTWTNTAAAALRVLAGAAVPAPETVSP